MIPWFVALQASLSMGFPRKKYWNGLPFPSVSSFNDRALTEEGELLEQSLHFSGFSQKKYSFPHSVEACVMEGGRIQDLAPELTRPALSFPWALPFFRSRLQLLGGKRNSFGNWVIVRQEALGLPWWLRW